MHTTEQRLTDLDDCILAVHLTLVALREDLNLLTQLLCFGHAHDATPLMVDFDAVDMGVCLQGY